MEIKKLKKKVEEQREENVRLFKIFEYKMHKEEMQPILEKWREGSKILKSMIKELQELEAKEKSNKVYEKKNEKNTFINGFGEATKRNISSLTYERTQKRKAKEMLSFIGCR